MTDEDRLVAAEGGEDVAFVAPEPDAYRRVLQRRREPDALVHPARRFGGASSVPTSIRRSTLRGSDYERVNQLFAERVVAELDNKPGAAVSLSGLPPLPRARLRARRAAGCDSWRTSSTSRGPSTGRSCRRRCARAVHEGLLANDVVGFHTARWAASLRASCAEIVGDLAAGRIVTHHAISIDTAEFDALAQSTRRPRRGGRDRRVSGPRNSSLRVDRTDPSKNIVRGSRSVRPAARRPSRVARARGRCSRSSIRRGSRFPSTSTTVAAIEREAEESIDASASPAGTCRPAGRGQLPALRRRVQAVRRAARECGLRRAEPGREGGAARQRRATACLSCPRTRARTRSLGSGRHGQPVRRRRARPRRCTRHSRWSRPERARRTTAIRGHVRAHDLQRGSRRCSPTRAGLA